MSRPRFELRLDPAALAVVERIAHASRTSRTAVIMDAIAILDAIDRRPVGHYVGTCSDREALASVIAGAR